MKKLIQHVLGSLGYSLVKTRSLVRYDEPEFDALRQRIKPFTMVPADRTHALYEAVTYVAKAGIPGDIVECGVWRGGQAMLMALTLKKHADTGRTIWLYDTYSGMTKPEDGDVSLLTAERAIEKWHESQSNDHNEWCYAPEDDVQKNVFSTGYPEKNFRFVKGKVEDTIPATMPDKIAILRLDTDWYKSTKHELEHLYPRLVPGGVLVLDDYESWAGARQAVDEYFKVHNVPMLLMRAGEGRIGIKIA